MAVKVGWLPWPEKSWFTMNNPSFYHGYADLIAIEPEKLDTWKGSTNGFTKCPAFAGYVNSTYMLHANIDLELEWDKTNRVLRSNLHPDAHNSYIHLHTKDFNPDTDPPIVGISANFLFVADQPVIVEMTPAYYHQDPGMRIMPGAFNIYNWQRPVVPTFEMLVNNIKIKRGQPLMYVRFKTENFKDNVILERIERTEKLDHAVNSCLTVKTFQPNLSWKIASTINKIRPKNFLKK